MCKCNAVIYGAKNSLFMWPVGSWQSPLSCVPYFLSEWPLSFSSSYSKVTDDVTEISVAQHAVWSSNLFFVSMGNHFIILFLLLPRIGGVPIVQNHLICFWGQQASVVHPEVLTALLSATHLLQGSSSHLSCPSYPSLLESSCASLLLPVIVYIQPCRASRQQSWLPCWWSGYVPADSCLRPTNWCLKVAEKTILKSVCGNFRIPGRLWKWHWCVRL